MKANRVFSALIGIIIGFLVASNYYNVKYKQVNNSCIKMLHQRIIQNENDLIIIGNHLITTDSLFLMHQKNEN
jgi:hypothetical protein